MKKYLFGALALPLLFACSSEDFDEKVVSNDPFAGIPKVDATFSFADGAMTRMATKWALENGDLYGFAWLGFGGGTAPLTINGEAYENHPLTQTDGIFKPATSIYVGKYFLYRPYDYTTVDIDKIKFNSLVEQDLTEGQNGAPWRALAKNAIIIGDKFTNVTAAGTPDAAGTVWDKAGINEDGSRQHYSMYAAFFSNQSGLDLTYDNNNLNFDGKKIKGATDIDYTYPAGSEIGGAKIYKADVQLSGAANSFTYGPTVEPNPAPALHSGTFWANKSGATAFAVNAGNGFNFNPTAAITLKNEAGVETGAEDSKGYFWFNSLPNTLGTATLGDNVNVVLETTYGDVTINELLQNCAYVYDDPSGAGDVENKGEWIKLVNGGGDNLTATPKEWDFTAAHTTFINHYGNHKGKYVLDVDFKTGDMSTIHVRDDAHLQQVLKFWIAAGKTGALTLNLDKDADNEFKISKISIALIQTINAGGDNIKVQVCGITPGHAPARIVVTQAGQAGVEGLDGKTEVPALDGIFAAATDVYLSKDYTWKWSDKIKTGTTAGQLTIDGNVKSLTNEGTLTVNADNIDLSIAGLTITNAAGATMNITKVTTAKTALTNLGTINVGAADNTSAELRAYDVVITNDAQKLLTPDEIINGEITGNKEIGRINNYGVVGVSDIGTSGKFNNYGLIDVKNAGAITLLSSNQDLTNFDNLFNAASNKMGTVKLPSPTALVSVNNKAANGFIAYNWTGTPYVTPEGNVKFNTIVVSGDIEFTVAEPEIKYIIFNGTRTQVINNGYLTNLQGVIVNAGKSIIIEKGNTLAPADGTFLGAGATVYKGGIFTHNASVTGTTASNYFGTWETTQIVKY